MKTKIALITGITGQDGSYLADLLLSMGYAVHGIVRRTSSLERWRLKSYYEDKEIYNHRLFLHYADLSDITTLRRITNQVKPSEFYHLAGQSHVGLSFSIPESTADLAAMSTLRLLEMIRDMPDPPRFYHASSSEIFGKPEQKLQDEQTPHRPVTPYGVAKSFATQMTRVYRETFGLFACNGIAYNHESPHRGENFVSRKICRGAVAVKLGMQAHLDLGDTTNQRDWGFAPDYVRGMWLALQHDIPDDYVLATGVLHSVQDIIDIAFGHLELNTANHVRKVDAFIRAGEPTQLVGNPQKAERQLGWKRTVTFEQMIVTMVEAELADALSGRLTP